MKIIIPIVFYRRGGVERVIVSLISHLEKYAETIVILIHPKDFHHFKSILPPSDTIIYESFSLYRKTIESAQLSLIRQGVKISKKLNLKKLNNSLYRKIPKLLIKYRINQLVRHYNIDCCLYAIINKLDPPEISIPLTGIAYDLFWEFSPLTYSEKYREKYNRPLKNWLNNSNLIFTISQKTRSDILQIFPDQNYSEKLRAVPLAGSPISFSENISNSLDLQETIFYFPSSFGIYKDHLTLLKAACKLSQKDCKFRIILTGKETDNLANGSISLSQQSSTKEYQEYIDNCNNFYQENQQFMQQNVKGCGYADYQDVEYYYQTCSCVVMPSKYEGFGLAISEALLLGIPVIAADLEVYREQVELYQCPSRVEFFPPGDVEALAACMEKFILNPLPRLSATELAENCRPWTWDDVAKEYIEALQSLK